MLHQAAVKLNTLKLLKNICKFLQFSEFALGGGTNVALRNGHCISVDLDFFTCIPFQTETIYKAITTYFEKVELLF